MTPKQRVLKRYRKAVCIPWYMTGVRAYLIEKTNAAFSHGDIGSGTSPRAAWADAAKRLKIRSTQSEGKR